MTLQVLTAITGPQEAPLVAALGGAGPSGRAEVTVVRRCADLPDVLAAAEAGLAEAAVLSADLGLLDLEAVGRLQRCGVAVVGLVPGGSGGERGEAAALRLRRLGVDAVLEADGPPDRLAGRLVEAVRRAIARRQAEGARAGGLLLGERSEPAAGTGPVADPGDALPLRAGPPAPRRPRLGEADREGPGSGG